MHETIFGIPVRYEKWDREGALPRTIQDAYSFQVAFLDEIRCIILTPKDEGGTLPNLKKQIERMKLLDPVPVVLQFTRISPYRRQSLIENRIPFLTDKQIYLPFLGAYLMNEGTEEKPGERFAVSTQQLFLLYLYENKGELYISDASAKLPFSAMTVTRAVRQLEATGLFRVSKDGVHVVLEGKYSQRELLAKAECYLSSPVRKTVFLEKSTFCADMCLAGESALSEKTSYPSPRVKTYAVFHKNVPKESLSDELFDPDQQVQLQLWNYDPRLFSKGSVADGISLALSFQENKNEKINGAIDELIRKLV